MLTCVDHDWQARPEGTTDARQHYRCEACGAWAWRRFGRRDPRQPTPYADGRRFDAPEVRSTATKRGAGPDIDQPRDGEVKDPSYARSLPRRRQP